MMANKFMEKRIVDAVSEVQGKIDLYSCYVEPDRNGITCVMVDETDIVTVRWDQVEQFQGVGFALFGISRSERELMELVAEAEYS